MKRQILAGSLALSLLGGLLAPAVAAAQSPQAPDASPAAETSSAEKRTQSTPTQVTSGLEILVNSVNTVRAGGDGAIELDVAHRSQDGVTARNVVLHAKFGKGIRPTDSFGEDWKCRTTKTQVTCTKPRIAAESDGNSVLVSLDGARSLRNGSVKAKTWVTWREPRTARHKAAGVTPPKRKGASKWRTYLDRTTGRVPTSRSLSMKVARLGPAQRLTDGVGQDDLVLFSAKIKGLNGAVAPITWRQICTDRAEVKADPECEGVAPKATMLQPRTDSEAEKDAAVSVQLPTVTKPTKMTFEASVMDGGVRVAGRASVIAVPFNPIKFTSDVDTVEEFAALTKDMNSQKGLRGTRQVFTKGTIRGASQPKAGRQVKLALRMPKQRITRVQWSVTAGPGDLLAGATRNGKALRFKAPSSMAGRTAVIEARAQLRDGRRIEFSKLLTFSAKKKAETTRNYTLMAADAATQQALGVEAQARVDRRRTRLSSAQDARVAVATAEGSLCSIARIIQSRQIAQPPSQYLLDPVPDLVLDGGAMLWVGDQATVDTATCSPSTTIDLDNAVLMYGTHMFTGVRGAITMDGLQIRGGTYQVPEEWKQEIPGLSGANASLDFDVPKSLPISAPLKRDGSWGALGGEVTFPTGLELVPLPNGWRFQPSVFRFETTGLMALTVTARAPAAQGQTAESLGRVSITGAVSPSGELEVDVVAANLVMFEDADGNEVTLDFDGALQFLWEDDPVGTADSALALQVVPDIAASVNNVKLSEYVVAERIGVNWTPGRIGGEFNLRLGTGDPANTVSNVRSTFVYEGAESWQVLAAYDGAWDVGAGLVIRGLKGEIDKDGKRLNISLAGDATGWKPSSSFELSSIRADLTNKCSPRAAKPGATDGGQECDSSAVRVDLDAVGVLDISGKRVDWTSAASFDLGTKKYTIRGTLSSADGLGPDEFNLRDISIAVSNQNTRRLCAPLTPGAEDTVFQITATGTVLGADVDFAGEYGTDTGTCFIGNVQSGQTKNVDLPNPEAFGNLQFAWVAEDAMLDLQTGQTRAKGKQLIISADYEVPADWNRIGVTRGTFFGNLGYAGKRVSVAAEVAVEFGAPGTPGPIIFGEAGTNHLTIDAVGFEVSYSGTGAFSLTAAALMTYRTVANTATDTIDSTTPFSVAISVGSNGLVVESKVDADRGSPAGTGGISGAEKQEYTTPPQIENAFGTSGLIVRQLGLMAMLGTNTSIAFNADVTLPERWSSAMGMHPQAQIALGGALSQTNPCFKFGMKVAPDKAGPEDFVVNLGKGLLAAREMRLVVAPTGCVLPGNEYIAPGFGMTFDGLIGGTFEVRVAMDVVLPTTVNPNLFINADINVDELNLGSVVTIDKTVLKFTVDTAQQLYELRVIGGIDVFGQRASIDAYFRSQGLGNITLNARSNVDLSLLGVASSNAKLDIGFEMVNFDVKVLKIDALMNFKVLGTTVAGMRAALIYDEGEVIDLELAVSVGLNIIVGSFSGTLGVEYFYDCQGVKLCASKQYTHRNMKMYLKGSVRILFWRTSFNLDIVDYREPVSSDRQARQSGQWKGQAEAEAVTPNDIVWTSARKTALYSGEVTNTWNSRIVSVKYDTAGKVTADGGEIDQSQSSGRGNVIVTGCIVKPGTRICRDKEEFTYRAEVYFQSRKIVLPQGQITGEAVTNGKCAFRCQESSVEFSGKDWDNITTMLNKARAEYAQANPGKSLPPIKMWSKDRPALNIGSVNSTPDGLEWMAGGSRMARYGARGQLPLTGDWDGSGYSELGHFTVPAPLGSAGWAQRKANGSTYSFQRFQCTNARHCGPIEPPGTAQYQGLPAEVRNGSSGYMFPIVGDWDEATTQHKAVDDLGIVAGDFRGSLTWRLWPRGQADIQFFFGGVKNGVVDRPVTGDWDGDGTTDIGVYRPPAAPGQLGTWLLVTSESLRRKLKTPGQFIEPDFTIEFGSFGSLPVTGDWDNDGVDGIGVVKRAGTMGQPNEWSLRNFANFDCPSDCVADVGRSEGSWGSLPVVGRWKSAY